MMFDIKLIYHYGEMVELYVCNLPFLSESERNQLTQDAHKAEGIQLYNSNPTYPTYSTLNKESALFIANWVANWEDERLQEEEEYEARMRGDIR